MSNRLHSRVHLAWEITRIPEPELEPVTEWGLLGGAVEYHEYYRELFDADGMLPWSESGLSLPFDIFYDADLDYGLQSWKIHLAGGIPGKFELGIWVPGTDDDPDVPGSVQVFTFTSRVIIDLPIETVHSDAPEDPPLATYKYRFWPGRLAELTPV